MTEQPADEWSQNIFVKKREHIIQYSKSEFMISEMSLHYGSYLQQRIFYKYSRTSNNGHCRGIQILSVIGGVR
jgi:hypothetical protein